MSEQIDGGISGRQAFSEPTQKFIAVNEHEPGLGFESEDQCQMDQFAKVTCHDEKHWVKNSEPHSEKRYAIIGVNLIIGPGGKRTGFYCDAFKPSTAVDARTKKRWK